MRTTPASIISLPAPEQRGADGSKRLRWPLILMLAVTLLSVLLIAIVIWDPTSTGGSYGSIGATP
jgi:hypothetical protein